MILFPIITSLWTFLTGYVILGLAGNTSTAIIAGVLIFSAIVNIVKAMKCWRFSKDFKSLWRVK